MGPKQLFCKHKTIEEIRQEAVAKVEEIQLDTQVSSQINARHCIVHLRSILSYCCL